MTATAGTGEGTGAPAVSVVVATFREPAAFLRDCLESLLGQERAAWEVIVVDDASNDSIAEAVVSTLDDDRITLVVHPTNLGMGAARNTGFRRARAPLIVPVDADDRLQPDFLSVMLDVLEANPTASWAFGDWQCFGSSSDRWSFPIPLPPQCPQHLVIPGPGTVMRRDVWVDVGGYVEDRAATGIEDWDFWISASELDLRGIHVPRALYLHRRHPAAMSVTASLMNDHVIRQTLYRRHRRRFEAFGYCPRCPPTKQIETFLSDGYVTSSSAAIAAGQPFRALRFALRAFTMRPGRRTARQMVRVIVPTPIAALARSLKHQLGRFSASRPASGP